MQSNSAAERCKVNQIHYLYFTGVNSKMEKRESQIIRTGAYGILVNVLMSSLKVAVGLLSNSVAIVMDAVNNFSDALSSIITIVGVKLSNKPADKKHPFGYGRLEDLTSLIISAIVLTAGITALVESIKTIIHPSALSPTPITLWIIGIAIIIKIILGIYTKKMGRKTGSDSLVASGVEGLFDAAIAAATLISALMSMFLGVNIDGWIGAVIGVFIIKTGMNLLLVAIGHILGNRIDPELSAHVKNTVRQVPGVLGAHDLILNNYGPNKMIGSVNIEVYDYLTVRELYVITKQVQATISNKFNIFLVVGVYSANKKDEKETAMQNSVTKSVTAHKYVIGMHAFYVDFERKVMSFDAVVDFKAPNVQELKSTMITEIEKENPGYKVVIQIDRDYSD